MCVWSVSGLSTVWSFSGPVCLWSLCVECSLLSFALVLTVMGGEPTVSSSPLEAALARPPSSKLSIGHQPVELSKPFSHWLPGRRQAITIGEFDRMPTVSHSTVANQVEAPAVLLELEKNNKPQNKQGTSANQPAS